MFTIDVSSLLTSYTGDSQTFNFEGEVPAGTLGNLELASPLKMRVKLVTLDDGIEVVFEEISSTIRHDGRPHTLSVTDSHYTYTHEKKWAEHISDDDMIDLAPAITQELTIARNFL